MAGTQQLGVKYPIAFAAGDDFTLTLTATESAAAYVWGTVEAVIVGHATITAFTVSLPADGTAVLSLTDAQTTTLGVGGYAWYFRATKAGYSQTWLSGTLTVNTPGTPGSSAVSATVTVTTGSTTTVTVTSTGDSVARASIADHLADTADAHDASAVSVLDTAGYYAGTNVETVLAELPTSFTPAGALFAPLKTALAAGASTGFGVVGDSTGNASDEWVALFGAHLAAMYPTYTVNHWTFNSSTESFDPPTVLQTGAGGERWVVFSSGDALSFPDSAITSPTGDLEIIVRVALNDWTPASEQVLAAKFGGGGQRTFRFYVDANNGSRPTFEWSADGTTLISKPCPSGQGWSAPADGAATWLRVTLDVNNGASGNTVTYYTGSTYGTWTQVGQVITAGTTSLFDSTTALQVGVRGGVGAEGATMAGKVGHVEIRNGLAGELIAPVLPELWQQTNANVVDLTGAPVLSIVNGSVAGYAITDINETTRVKKLTPDFGQAVTIVSCSHNDFYRSGAPYLADFDTLKSRIDARLPLSTLAVTTQNPRTSPATYLSLHAKRAGEQVGWARRNNAGVIDAFAAFTNSATAIADLVSPSDGVHPTTAGSALWAETVERAFGTR